LDRQQKYRLSIDLATFDHGSATGHVEGVIDGARIDTGVHEDTPPPFPLLLQRGARHQASAVHASRTPDSWLFLHPGRSSHRDQEELAREEQ
jgi:hypothetical protein